MSGTFSEASKPSNFSGNPAYISNCNSDGGGCTAFNAEVSESGKIIGKAPMVVGTGLFKDPVSLVNFLAALKFCGKDIRQDEINLLQTRVNNFICLCQGVFSIIGIHVPLDNKKSVEEHIQEVINGNDNVTELGSRAEAIFFTRALMNSNGFQMIEPQLDANEVPTNTEIETFNVSFPAKVSIKFTPLLTHDKLMEAERKGAREIQELKAQLEEAQKRNQDLEDQLKEAQNRNQELKDRLEAAQTSDLHIIPMVVDAKQIMGAHKRPGNSSRDDAGRNDPSNPPALFQSEQQNKRKRLDAAAKAVAAKAAATAVAAEAVEQKRPEKKNKKQPGQPEQKRPEKKNKKQKQPEPEPDASTQPEPQPEPEPDASTQPEPQPEPEPDASTQPEPQPEPEPNASAQPSSHVDADVLVQLDARKTELYATYGSEINNPGKFLDVMRNHLRKQKEQNVNNKVKKIQNPDRFRFRKASGKSEYIVVYASTWTSKDGQHHLMFAPVETIRYFLERDGMQDDN